MIKFLKKLFTIRKPIKYDYKPYITGDNINSELKEIQRLEKLINADPIMGILYNDRLGYLKKKVRKDNIKGFESLL